MHERYSYDNFVIPYMLGLIFIITYFVWILVRGFILLPREDKRRLGKMFFGKHVFLAVKEIFFECLLHIKIWRKNPLLGFMHSSIAMGWFMLIVIGHIEVKLYAPHRFNMPYFPIFFRYFMKETEHSMRGSFLFFLMDFFLLLVLLGICLALFKRFRSQLLGMRRTTKLKFADKFAVYSMWCIFPLRLIAESYTADIAGGSFLTRFFNHLVGNIGNGLWVWWGYSIALAVFFFALPWSRFMHIPTEAVLILMRRAGIRSLKKGDSFSEAELYSCSRCGLCIDVCQMSSQAKLHQFTSVYFMRELRGKNAPEYEKIANACMMCRRCVDACPVAIDTCQLKLNVRTDNAKSKKPAQYDYLPRFSAKTAELIYFAGCMTRTMPSIEKAMIALLDASGQKYLYMDKEGSICCGRPMMLAGKDAEAQKLIDANSAMIRSAEAKTLVTSCPICYKIFKEKYALKIKILHHSQWIDRLIKEGKISVEKQNLTATYHDPCDLGRGRSVYKTPREVLTACLSLREAEQSGKNALCCGGSTASLTLTSKQRRKITEGAMEVLTKNSPDYLVTACPLCKNTFGGVESKTEIIDLAELVVKSIRRRQS